MACSLMALGTTVVRERRREGGRERRGEGGWREEGRGRGGGREGG